MFGRAASIGLARFPVWLGLIAAFGGYSFGALRAWQRACVGNFGAVLLVFVLAYLKSSRFGNTHYTLEESIGSGLTAIVPFRARSGRPFGDHGEGWVGAAGVVTIGRFSVALRRTAVSGCLGMAREF